MLQVNMEKSGELGGGIGETKFLVVIDSPDREEVEGAEARRLALDTASRNGFGNAGLTDNPLIGAVDSETGEMVNITDPTKMAELRVSGYRAEFTLARRL